jgi:hypothetical protein
MKHVSKLVNISEGDVVVETSAGGISLEPGQQLSNASINNLEAIRDRVSIVEDLTEVNHAKGKQCLNEVA